MSRRGHVHQLGVRKGEPAKRGAAWYYSVDTAPKGAARRKLVKHGGFPTRAAAQAELNEVLASLDHGTYVAPKRQTFADFVVSDWLPAVRLSLEESTWASYERYLRLHVVPHVGDIQLQTLDPVDLNRLYAELSTSGRRDGKPGGLSPRTVRYIATIVHRALKDAVRWNRIVRNPADAAQPPRAREAKAPPMRTWTGAELERFLELEQGGHYYPAWFFLGTTGARRGEALGLRWQDVDLKTGRVSIRQTITAIDHRVHVSPTTKTGRARVIDLDVRTVAVLKSQRARQAEERLALGGGLRDEDLVFCHFDGRPYHPDRFSREFDRRVARHGLPRIRVHDLRHSWATMALESGVDVRVVQERLGHSTSTITRDTYQHVSPAMQSDAAERVAAQIFGGCQ